MLKKNIAFIGTGGVFSKIVLNELLRRGIKIKLVIINIKRGSKQLPLNLEICEKYKISYLITDNINSKEVEDKLSKKKIDLACIASLHQIIKSEIFNIPKDGMINFHPSYLPYYQGANPWFWMIRNNEDNFGASIHYITDEVDKGNIILREQINLEKIIDGEEIFYNVAILGAKLLTKTLESYNKAGLIIKDINISYDELEKGFYNRRPTNEDYKLNMEEEKPSKTFKFVNRIIRWGKPWFSINGKIISITRAVKFNENESHDFKIIHKGNFMEVHNRYGLIILETILNNF